MDIITPTSDKEMLKTMNETKEYKIGDIVKAEYEGKPIAGKIISIRDAVVPKNRQNGALKEYSIEVENTPSLSLSYVVPDYNIVESIQKTEAITKASKQLLSWAKLSQVKAAIAGADEKTFRKLMEEFTKSISSTEDFPMTSIKDGKLVFALTDTPITIDSLVKECFDDRYLFESSQKTEDFKDPKTYDELKPGEWYEVEGKLFQIADRQPIDNEVQAFKVFPDYSVGSGVHVLYKSFFKPDRFKFVDKRDKITKVIKEKEAQIAKLKQEIDALKEVLTMKSEKNEAMRDKDKEGKPAASRYSQVRKIAETMKAPELIQVTPTRFYNDIAKGGLEHEPYEVLKSTDCYELQKDTDSHTIALCTVLLDPRQDMPNLETISFEPCSVVVGTLSDTKHSVLGWHVVHGTTCMLDFALNTPLDVIAELTNIYFSHFIEPVTVELLQQALDLYNSTYANEMTELVVEAKDTEFIDFPRSELPDETADMLLDISTLEQGMPIIEAEDYRNLYNELKEDFSMDAMQSLELDLGDTHTKLMNHEAKALRLIYEE